MRRINAAQVHLKPDCVLVADEDALSLVKDVL